LRSSRLFRRLASIDGRFPNAREPTEIRTPESETVDLPSKRKALALLLIVGVLSMIGLILLKSCSGPSYDESPGSSGSYYPSETPTPVDPSTPTPTTEPTKTIDETVSTLEDRLKGMWSVQAFDKQGNALSSASTYKFKGGSEVINLDQNEDGGWMKEGPDKISIRFYSTAIDEHLTISGDTMKGFATNYNGETIYYIQATRKTSP
jgi:hypothetical protein